MEGGVSKEDEENVSPDAIHGLIAAFKKADRTTKSTKNTKEDRK